VLNTNQVICTVDKKQRFEAEFDVRIGRGFFTGNENKRADMPLGVIPIDSIFSPVIRVKYSPLAPAIVTRPSVCLAPSCGLPACLRYYGRSDSFPRRGSSAALAGMNSAP